MGGTTSKVTGNASHTQCRRDFAQPYVLLAQYVSVGNEVAVAKEVVVTKKMVVAMLGGKPLRRVPVQRILGKCNSANSTPHVRGG